MNGRLVCPYAGRCGSCDHIGEEYSQTVSEKQKMIEKQLPKEAEPVIAMNFPYYYRYKVTYALSYDYRKRKIICGKYKKGSHEVVEIKECITESRECQKLVHFITDLMPQLKIKAYDEDLGTGNLRYIFVRESFATGDLMLVLVSADKDIPGKKHLTEEITKAFPKVKSIYQCVNRRSDSMVLTDDMTLLYGEKYLTDRVMGKTFRLSPQAFYQVNPAQMKKLYQTAIDEAELSGNERIIDAYCGIGTIGICASDKVSSIVGIENNPSAVHDAIENARANGIKNARYICADAADVFMGKGIQAGVVFMDPPRAGADRRFIESLMQLSPEKIVYISCNPETLKRDLKILTKSYRIKKIQPLDMFCFSDHIETAISLIRR